MSKITIFILFMLIGAATYTLILFYDPFPQFTGPIKQAVQSTSDLITQQFQSFQFLTANPAFVTAMSSLGVALVVNYIRAKMQERIENKARMEIEKLQTELAQLHNVKAQLEYEKNQLQQQIITSPANTLQQQIINLQQELLAKEREIERLIHERNEAERLLRAKYFAQTEPERVE